MKGKREYLALLRDYRQGFGYLPEEYYISQFEDNSFYYIASFEEDKNRTTTSQKDFSIIAETFTVWEEKDLTLRDLSATIQHNSAVFLEWDNNHRQSFQQVAQYKLCRNSFCPDDSVADTIFNNLFFFICNDSENIDLIDFTIQLVFSDGVKVGRSFSSYYNLPPLLNQRLTKCDFIFSLAKNTHERVLQYIEIPLAEFSEGESIFRYKDLQEINFIFDKNPQGKIILDRIGLN